MTRGAFPSLRRVTACAKDARCQCRARGVVTVRGFGHSVAAYYRTDYREGSCERITAGVSSGGPKRKLTPGDFAAEAMQAALVTAFAVALSCEIAAAPKVAT